MCCHKRLEICLELVQAGARVQNRPAVTSADIPADIPATISADISADVSSDINADYR